MDRQPAPRPRAEIYADILKWGLLELRTAAENGNQELCLVEADHLHNLPNLLNEANEARHKYYYEKERCLYLDRIKELCSPPSSFTLNRYEDLGSELGNRDKQPLR